MAHRLPEPLLQHLIILPDLGQTISEATVLKWLKRPGDQVRRGEPLRTVETDKVDMDVEAFADGYLREVLVEQGAVASALAPVAILTDQPGEAYSRPADASRPRPPVGPPGHSRQPPDRPDASAGTPATAAPAASVGAFSVAAAPSAGFLAKELGIDLRAVSGTGPGGLIIKSDVERVARSGADRSAGPTPAPGNLRALRAMAEISAGGKREIPHFYASLDADVAAAAAWRAGWNAAHPDLPASFNDLFVRAASCALLDVPRLNVSYQDGAYEQRSEADVLLIVTAGFGLSLVPIAAPQALPWGPFSRK